MVCTNCGCKIPDGASVCRVCGGGEAAESRSVPQMSPAFFKAPDLEFTPRVPRNPCPHCGRLQPEDATFCGGCQRMLRTVPSTMVNPQPPIDTPAPEPVPVAEPIPPEPVPVVEPVIEIPAPTKTCPGCGRELPMEAKFCNGCGRNMAEKPAAAAMEPIPAVEPIVPEPVIEIPVPTKTCPGCGLELPLAAKFCNRCGMNAEEKPAAAAEEPIAVGPIAPEPTIVIPSTTKICSSCGRELPLEAKFCNGCGAKTDGTPVEPPAPMAPTATAKLCPDCGRELAMEAKFCNGCGCDLAASAITNAAAVTVTDPVVITTAEKKAKAKKAKSGKSGKGIVIAVVAIALAIVVGLGVWIALEDPFDWFGGGGSDEEDEGTGQTTSGMTADELALEYVKACYEADAADAVDLVQKEILLADIADMGYSEDMKDDYVSDFQTFLETRNNELTAVLGEDWTYASEISDQIEFDDLSGIQASYKDMYDLEISDCKMCYVMTDYQRDGETISTVEETLTLIKVGNKWYVRNVQDPRGVPYIPDL